MQPKEPSAFVRNYDVLIIGGGPAGSTCAMGFIDSGYKVAVIEKSNFPREKVCGDGMGGYIPKALNRISPKFGQAFKDFEAKFSVSNIRIWSFNGQTAKVKLPQDFFISQRYHFDNFLYEQASSLPEVDFFMGAQVTGVSVDTDKAIVSTSDNQVFHAKLIIACDGATSFARRALTGYKLALESNCAAVRAYFENVEGIQQDTFEFFFLKKYPKSYFWIFPSFNNQANVGFGMMSDDVKQQELKLREVLLEIIEENPEVKKRFENSKLVGDIKGWSIPFAYGEFPIMGDRFLLGGDAACMADPASGEGIGQAVVSGRIAAFHAKQYLAQNDFSASNMASYGEAMEEKFGSMHKKRSKIADRFSKNTWIMDSIVGFINLGAWPRRLFHYIFTKLTT